MNDEEKPCQADAVLNPKRKPRLGVVVEYQPVNLDFAKLEKICGLTFSDELALCIQTATDDYRHLTSPESKAPPTTEVRTALQHIVKACDLLSPMLEAYARGEISPTAEAVRSAYPSREYVGWIEEGQLAVFLVDMAAQAKEAAEEPGKRGHPGTQEQNRLILAAHEVYKKAGGKGRGCTTDGTTESGYSGPFYNLVLEIIRQTDGCVMNPSGIGKAIVTLIHLETNPELFKICFPRFSA